MNLQVISLYNLSLAFIPVAITLFILYRWSLDATNALYAVVRMLVQLLLIGYLLAYIFAAENTLIIFFVLTVMIVASSWIALGPVRAQRRRLFRYAFLSILIGGATVLALMTQGVLVIEPWYQAQAMIPLAGMIFANSMNSVSLAAERLTAEMKRGGAYEDARTTALQSSMIPVINSLFAVGLVSLPGMMTGQILSGVSPLVAARYQIMVMCMIFGSAGISTAVFLAMTRTAFCEIYRERAEQKPG
jgi:putative ABC transport system permease protein